MKHFWMFFCFFPLFGEINPLQIEVKTNFCDARCRASLKEEMVKAYKASPEDISVKEGFATVRWPTSHSFSYRKLSAPFHKVGVALTHRGVYLSVTGALRVTDDKLFFISSGDRTEFTLASPDEGLAKPNPILRTLTPALRKALIDFAEGEEIEIKGELSRPSRSPPLVLIVHQYKKTNLNSR